MPSQSVTFAAFVLLSAATARSQCANQWVAGSGLPAVGSRSCETVVWDSDGAGPLPPVLVVGGAWITSPTAPPDFLASVDLTTGALTPLGVWTFGDVTALAVLANGELVAAGTTVMSPNPVTTIARLSQGAWLPIGVADRQVSSMVVASNGDLFAAGLFTTLNGMPLNGIARWDAASWSSLGSGLSGSMPYADEMVLLPNGDLVAGGMFTSAGGVAVPGLARWNGSSWFAIGSGYPGYWTLALAVASNGDLLAGGHYTPLSRWDGATWTTLGSPSTFGNGFVEAITVLPDGDVLAGAAYTQDPVMRWNGTAWVPAVAGATASVTNLTNLPNGDVAVGLFGGLTAPGVGPLVGIAWLSTACPATTMSYSASCASSGGSNTLTANLPWTGGTWRAQGTGLPAPAFVLAVTGFAPVTVPLGSLLTQGVPNCSLRVQPDHVLLTTASGGSATVSWAIPDTPVLAGIPFHHQFVSLEYAPPLQIVVATASNALRMVIGTF